MRKSLLLLTLLTLQTNYAQWVQQNSGTASNILDVEFINRYTGWACGDGGIILKTSNGGINWQSQITGVSGKNLFGIHPVNENIVYCVGWFETIIKTTDGGNNWSVIRNGPYGSGASFYELYFINENTGWLLRDNYILRTTNGGQTFDSTYSIYTYMMDIYFKDAQTGVLCGDGALIMRSTDGGVNWNKITIPLYNFYIPDFYKISFANNNAWVIGRGRDFNLGCLVWRTANFGINWDTIGRVQYPQGTEAYCIYFSSLYTGWTGGSYGHVFKTSNSGFNWIEENTQAGTGFIRSMWFYNDSVGWGVGGGGKIIHTTNSGMPVSVANHNGKIPDNFILYQNYPNPFNSQTTIEFSLPDECIYKMELYNEIGQLIKEIFNENIKQGNYKLSLDASELSSGIYFYVLSSGDIRQSKKLIIIK